MKNTLLHRAIRLLVDGEECVRNENTRTLLMRHRTEFRVSVTALMEPPMSGLMEPLTGADLGSRTG